MHTLHAGLRHALCLPAKQRRVKGSIKYKSKQLNAANLTKEWENPHQTQDNITFLASCLVVVSVNWKDIKWLQWSLTYFHRCIAADDTKDQSCWNSCKASVEASYHRSAVAPASQILEVNVSFWSKRDYFTSANSAKSQSRCSCCITFTPI